LGSEGRGLERKEVGEGKKRLGGEGFKKRKSAKGVA